MFRTLGLRHVIVLNSRSEVVGIVARAELLESNLHACIGAKKNDTRQRNFDQKQYGYLGQIEMAPFGTDNDRQRLVSDFDSGSSTNEDEDQMRNGNGQQSAEQKASIMSARKGKSGVVKEVRNDNEDFFGDEGGSI
jgi:hypothetical protein